MSSREPNSAEAPVEPLTRREREILALLAEGLSGPEIAQKLTLARSSVKWHLRQVYGKLGVNSKQRALLRAQELGLLVTPGATAEPKPADAPPPALAPRHNLPLQLTNFIGRTQQIAEVKRLLRANRLLTLIGPGGTGKTRLALQVAAEMLDEFPDGAWLVDLAPIAEPALVPQAVAKSLGLRAATAESFEEAPVDPSGRDALPLIVEHLRDQSLLLILDNCEHLVAACAQLAEQLLRAAPRLLILTTSREALGVWGESSYPVPALSLPDTRQQPSLETLAQSEAVRLFIERAQAVRPDFGLTEENAPAVAQICQRLDGIPLAIELAAARVRALTAEQIAAHLDDRFRLLTSGSRSAPPRQQTLRGAIDWSYDLLADGERALLRRLSVFAGGWTLEAAEQVGGGPEALDWLTQLVAKSLVLSEQPPGQAARFRMLETIREYSHEKLAEAGESEAVRGQHLAYFLELAEEAEPELRGRGQVKWLPFLNRESDNLRAALTWAVKKEDAESALRLAGALARFWLTRNNAGDGRDWLEAALPLQMSHGPLGPSLWLARAILAAGYLDIQKDLSASLTRLQQALEMYRELGNTPGAAYAVSWIARHHMVADKDYARALDLFREALDAWQSAKDTWGSGYCFHWMGHAAEKNGDRAGALEFYQRSVVKLREAGDGWELAGPLNDLIRLDWAGDDTARRRGLIEDRRNILRALGDPLFFVSILSEEAARAAAQGDYARAREIALSMLKKRGNQLDPTPLARLGEAEYLQGHLDEARKLFDAALEGWRQENDVHGQGWPLARLGIIAYRLGDLDQATRLLEQSREYLGPDGWWAYNLALVILGQADVARVRGESETAAKLYSRSLGIMLKENALAEMPDCLEGFAKLASATGQPRRAAHLFGASEALRERVGVIIPAVESADYNRAVATTRTQLDPAAFSAAWAEGQALGWEQAASYALGDDAR